MRSLLLAFALLAGSAPAAPVPKAVKKQDERLLLVGTWKPDKGSEWFRFDADGGMTAWMSQSPDTPAEYTYTVLPEPEGRAWRMTWTARGQQKPSCDAVFRVDGDGLRLQYTSAGGGPLPHPGTDPADKFFTFTRHPAK